MPLQYSPVIVGMLALIAGCGSGKSSSNVISGSANGVAFTSRSAGFGLIGADLLEISFSDIPDLCVVSANGDASAVEGRWLTITLCTKGQNPVGSYALAPGGPSNPCVRDDGWASFRSETGEIDPSGLGTINLSAEAPFLDGSVPPLTGSLVLVFVGGSSFRGSFSANYCPALDH